VRFLLNSLSVLPICPARVGLSGDCFIVYDSANRLVYFFVNTEVSSETNVSRLEAVAVRKR